LRKASPINPDIGPLLIREVLVNELEVFPLWIGCFSGTPEVANIKAIALVNESLFRGQEDVIIKVAHIPFDKSALSHKRLSTVEKPEHCPRAEEIIDRVKAPQEAGESRNGDLYIWVSSIGQRIPGSDAPFH
jgi:hypothetical protein